MCQQIFHSRLHDIFSCTLLTIRGKLIINYLSNNDIKIQLYLDKSQYKEQINTHVYLRCAILHHPCS